jgi:hypothetical protein
LRVPISPHGLSLSRRGFVHIGGQLGKPLARVING